MKQGSHEVSVLRQIARFGGDVPEAMQDEPEIETGNQLFWTAFWDLCSCRDVEIPIPWRDTQYWCDVHQLDREMTASLHYHIRAMDRVFLAHVAEKMKSEPSPQPEPSSANQRHRR